MPIIILLLLGFFVMGIIGMVFSAIADVFLGVWDFFINLNYIWFIVFTVVSSAIALLRLYLTEGKRSFGWTMFQLCALTMAVIFIIIPLAHSRRWNNDFNCHRDSQCYGDGKCIGGFCTVAFGGDFMGKAEFTQGQYKAYLHGQFLKDCEKFRGSRNRDWERHYKCENSVDAKVEDRFKDIQLPANCEYFEAGAKPEKALLQDDDAPMPCITRDEAAQICADLGGRLPNRQEYQSIFEEANLSCENTVMVGLDKFTGYITKLKHREIKRMKFGPGCGSGTFRQACDKHRHGNTKEGFCDVYGNVAEWTDDGGAIGGSFRSEHISKEGEMGANGADGANGARIDVGFRCLIIGEHL